MSEPIMSHSESIEINASPEKVWSLVTAMDRYGEWSSENTGGYWRKNEEGIPGTGAVGDEFVGINRIGDDEWKALVEIIVREEHKTFAFVTGGTAMNLIHWRYDLEPSDSGTTLTESWALMNLSPLMIEHGDEEIQFRAANAKESIAATLKGMKAAAES
ncbi:MAG: SRPBCC family protein [Acidimicrobiales bacterium]|nr:hypothetical protein [Acidimicrobiaceae bacterium]MBA4813323.1 SRPBCC family protein [Acidimicrobiales bacterium]MBD52672.1 hypothetical protein [Acidimicrobiaceae bacterium]RPH17772.1 MAG: SRPBCC family protein [Actinobacteria bacterium TMED270]HCJ86006.1 hypothetical protein [Acidimicrobiaceae bacterium]|tara:strand:- start:9986 stop:10462 length:477 start_codon:yes stop_codon:yes gene_type:complete